jgi:hypothetical protein
MAIVILESHRRVAGLRCRGMGGIVGLVCLGLDHRPGFRGEVAGRGGFGA